jgi:DUF177 domain-containing protein
VNVAELLARPGSSKAVRVDGQVEGLELRLARVVPDSPVRLDIRLDAIVEGVAVTGSVASTVSVECRRCLASTTVELSVPVSELYSSPDHPQADESYALHGEELDLEPMVRDLLMLAMPLNPLCREDCKGLCPACGQDLNDADCGHRPPGDLRWEPLRNLKQSLTRGKEE